MLTGKQILFIKKSPAGNALIKATLLADDSGKFFYQLPILMMSPTVNLG